MKKAFIAILALACVGCAASVQGQDLNNQYVTIGYNQGDAWVFDSEGISLGIINVPTEAKGTGAYFDLGLNTADVGPLGFDNFSVSGGYTYGLNDKVYGLLGLSYHSDYSYELPGLTLDIPATDDWGLDFGIGTQFDNGMTGFVKHSTANEITTVGIGFIY